MYHIKTDTVSHASETRYLLAPYGTALVVCLEEGIVRMCPENLPKLTASWLRALGTARPYIWSYVDLATKSNCSARLIRSEPGKTEAYEDRASGYCQSITHQDRPLRTRSPGPKFGLGSDFEVEGIVATGPKADIFPKFIGTTQALYYPNFESKVVTTVKSRRSGCGEGSLGPEFGTESTLFADRSSPPSRHGVLDPRLAACQLAQSRSSTYRRFLVPSRVPFNFKCSSGTVEAFPSTSSSRLDVQCELHRRVRISSFAASASAFACTVATVMESSSALLEGDPSPLDVSLSVGVVDKGEAKSVKRRVSTAIGAIRGGGLELERTSGFALSPSVIQQSSSAPVPSFAWSGMGRTSMLTSSGESSAMSLGETRSGRMSSCPERMLGGIIGVQARIGASHAHYQGTFPHDNLREFTALVNAQDTITLVGRFVGGTGRPFTVVCHSTGGNTRLHCHESSWRDGPCTACKYEEAAKVNRGQATDAGRKATQM
ncbi:hypothetical protein LXA43DRAFT_1068218 [Ganoderma leucocontextum]|nr:hypothetical protein LXA43DRAFT_1068218 [Ganoderma leucocontextum]